jgi:hypothetical protein
MAGLIGQIPEAGKTIQWIIEESNDWTPEEVETVVAPIREHMKHVYEKYGMVANNYWQLWKHSAGTATLFTAKKRTWEHGLCNGKTAEECALSIKEYFGKEQ